MLRARFPSRSPRSAGRCGCWRRGLATLLFYRNGRGVALTTAGEIFLGHARAVLERIERAEREIAALGGMPQGVVTLGLPPSVSAVLLRPLVVTLAARFPLIRLRVEEGFSGKVAEWLQSGKVDLAIVYQDKATSNFVSQKLLTEQLMLNHHPSLQPGAEITAAMLAGLPLALPARPHGLRRLVESGMAAQGQTLDIRFEMDSLMVLKGLAMEGVASTILPFGAVSAEVAAGMLVATPIVSPSLTRVMVLAMANGRALDTTHRAVIEVVREVAADRGVEHPPTPSKGEAE